MNLGTVARACIAVMALVWVVSSAQAQQRDRFGGPAPRAGHFDSRFNHNRFYTNRGAFVRAVPGRPVIVNRGGGRFFYSGGVWYAPRGPGFVVVGAPVGAFVPVLPPFYTTVWAGGVPFYYANDTYYLWNAAQSGYEVVDPPGGDTMVPPSGSVTTNGQPPPSGDDLYVYPQSGQSEEQQADDKWECHQWASSQSGFDPTRAGGGVAPEQAAAARASYQRAMSACLVGRGYSVK